MSKRYRLYQPEQPFLLPPSLTDWLPKDHIIYLLSDLVDRLDLSAVEKSYEEELRGQPPFHPRMMVKVLIYSYCSGVFSSRRIERRVRRMCPSGCWPGTTCLISGRSASSASGT